MAGTAAGGDTVTGVTTAIAVGAKDVMADITDGRAVVGATMVAGTEGTAADTAGTAEIAADIVGTVEIAVATAGTVGIGDVTAVIEIAREQNGEAGRFGRPSHLCFKWALNPTISL